MSEKTSPPKRDINTVVSENSERLMKIPGVVGVYVGLMKDGKTPCIRVMLKNSEPELSIPRTLEGYPVVTEVTGEIRPLRK